MAEKKYPGISRDTDSPWLLDEGQISNAGILQGPPKHNRERESSPFECFQIALAEAFKKISSESWGPEKDYVFCRCKNTHEISRMASLAGVEPKPINTIDFAGAEYLNHANDAFFDNSLVLAGKQKTMLALRKVDDYGAYWLIFDHNNNRLLILSKKAARRYFPTT